MILALLLLACSSSPPGDAAEQTSDERVMGKGLTVIEPPRQESDLVEAATIATGLSDVIDVQIDSAREGVHNFRVTVRGPDEGCARYNDWWEVVTPAGELVYRRILSRAHPGKEQQRSPGGLIYAADDGELIVRAHLKGSGYGGTAMRGTPATGFQPDPELPARLARRARERLPPADPLLRVVDHATAAAGAVGLRCA